MIWGGSLCLKAGAAQITFAEPANVAPELVQRVVSIGSSTLEWFQQIFPVIGQLPSHSWKFGFDKRILQRHENRIVISDKNSLFGPGLPAFNQIDQYTHGNDDWLWGWVCPLRNPFLRAKRPF
jgi:hypothetical protein